MSARRWAAKRKLCERKTLVALLQLSLHVLLLMPLPSRSSQAIQKRNAYFDKKPSFVEDQEQHVVSNAFTYAKIVRGKEAPAGRFPFMCSLRARGSRAHKCGATLFRRDWVLTAAHCVDPDVRGTIGLSPVVHCGIHDLDEREEDVVFDAVAGYIHPEWTGNVINGHDVAVLKLDRDAHLTLPRLGSAYVPVDAGDYLAATGWGATKSAHVAKTLRVADRLAVLYQQACEEYPRGADQDSWICAGALRQDTCTGDSGGPLMLVDAPDGNLSAGKPKLDMIVGITSFGYADDESGQCSGDQPAIYMNVDYFLDWMEWIVNCHPECRRSDERRHQELVKRQRQYSKLTEAEMISEMLQAIQKDNSLDAEALLLAGLDADAAYEEVDIFGLPKEKGSTLLHGAAAFNALKCAEVLVKYEACIGARNAKGSTPLHEAATNGSASVAKLLLSAGADANAIDDAIWTPLHMAARFGRTEIAKILVLHGADVETFNAVSWTPLHMAARFRRTEIVKILVDHGARLDTFSTIDCTPLHEAARRGFAQIVKILVESGADMDTFSRDKSTPLHEAALCGFTVVTKILVDHGADIKTINASGWTPLHVAVHYGGTIITKILAEAGAEIDATEENGWTPLHMATQQGSTVIIKILVDHGADLGAITFKGSTPLHIAAEYGRLDAAEVLVTAGACKTSKQSAGMRPLDLVCTADDSGCSDKTRTALIKLLTP